MTEKEIKAHVGRIKAISGIDLDSINYGSDQENGEINWNHASLYVPSENYRLKGGPYYYQGNSVVHFTSRQSLNAILESKSIRLSNLYKLNDPREFSFAGDLFGLSTEEREEAKSNMYLMSLCDSSILSAKEIADEFNLWRLYGDFGKGVAIEFSIVTNPEHWFEMHMSSVVYGARQRHLFRELYHSIQKLKQEISLDVKKLCAFHKSRIYNIEREVRLLYDGRKSKVGRGRREIHSGNGKLLFPTIDVDERDSRIQYLYLPIYRNDMNLYDYEDLPLFRIEKIHLGFWHKYDRDIKDQLEESMFNNLGYTPEVCFSRLIGAYWGKG